MSEINKRFSYENNKVKDNLTNEYHSSNLVSVNLLNQLNDENERLKKENKELKQLVKKMGELGGFNRHMIKTICGGN